jgi:hypothetical protein
MGMLCIAEMPSPGWSTYRNSVSCEYQSVSTRTTSIGAIGRSIMLNTGAYTVSQPGGVWKFVDPRTERAPGGVPRSSGTMKAVATRIASSLEIGGLDFAKATSCLIMPMPPTGSTTVSENSGSHLPLGLLRKYENRYRPSPWNSR